MPHTSVERVRMTILPSVEGAEIADAKVIGAQVVDGEAELQVNLYHRREIGSNTLTCEEREITLKPRTSIVGEIESIKVHSIDIIDGLCEMSVDLKVTIACMARQL